MLASCHHNMHLVYNQCYGNRAYKSVYQNGAFIKIANWAFVIITKEGIIMICIIRHS